MFELFYSLLLSVVAGFGTAYMLSSLYRCAKCTKDIVTSRKFNP